MAKATLNTGQILHAVNDIFIGPRSHVSARYSISIGKQTENHSSSGVIVSTGVGSTGWLKSLLAGATGIVQNAGSNTPRRVQQDLLSPPKPPPTSSYANIVPKCDFPWDADYLCFTVREPFPSKTTSATIVFGRVTAREPLILVSQMPEHGVIFSDGLEQDFLEFRSGTRAIITIAEKRGCLGV